MSGAVLGPEGGTKTRTVGLELDIEQKEAGSSWVGGRQKRGRVLLMVRQYIWSAEVSGRKDPGAQGVQ